MIREHQNIYLFHIILLTTDLIMERLTNPENELNTLLHKQIMQGAKLTSLIKDIF